jgi:hypothetical protein
LPLNYAHMIFSFQISPGAIAAPGRTWPSTLLRTTVPLRRGVGQQAFSKIFCYMFVLGIKPSMSALVLVLLIIAAVLFALAAFGVAGGRINLVAAGLLAWVLAEIVPHLS